MGAMEVPNQALWGAQTQRALEHFAISVEVMPQPLIHALAHIKRATAQTNAALGLLDMPLAQAIATAADEIITEKHANAFALSVWQTGSGTQTHMNMNEVLANRASELLGGKRGDGRLVHPNDHVNLGQSSNDVIPTAMHLATLLTVHGHLLPALQALQVTLSNKSAAFGSIIKTGRTHLQDATPITLGQEISAWASQLAWAQQQLLQRMEDVQELAIGGTAVGTGVNTHPDFGKQVAQALGKTLNLPLRCAANPFASLGAHDALVAAHGALKNLAVVLVKVANDIRLLASGPRCGLGELRLPANEPGSSIMPGKVNPSHCEALAMVGIQVMANDLAVAMGGAAGHLQLNTAKPLIAHNVLQSVRLLADGMRSFDIYCAQGIEPDRERIASLLSQSLMLVTALSPHIGYDKAAAIAQMAHAQGCTLREAALAMGAVTAQTFDALVRPEQMV